MTYREMLSKNHSEEGVKEIVKAYCPSDYFETASELGECIFGGYDKCERCWSQQIPQDKQDIEEATMSAYDAGAEDAKRAVLKICNQTLDESQKMFGLTILHEILAKFSMMEILRRFEIHETEISIGDVVEIEGGEMGIIAGLADTMAVGIKQTKGIFILPVSRCQRTGENKRELLDKLLDFEGVKGDDKTK